MQLKVGELARSSGLTVRTLHHYDEIGLLKPSGRSESGYRLYDRQDVARLHAIQALRHLGLPLQDIASLVDGASAAPQMVVEQQIKALDRQIAQATELRAQLTLIHDGLRQGTQPPVGDWLQALSLMATYGKYFSAAELKSIFTGWKKIATDWPALMEEVRALMDAGAAPESEAAQGMARRWMALVHHWMDGDFDLIQRWGEMYRQEPAAHGRGGGPPTDMFAYMQKAIDLRMALLRRHFSPEQLQRVRYIPESRWRGIDDQARALLRDAVPPADPRARALAREWLDTLDELVDRDPAMRAAMMRAQLSEPLLQAGSAIGREARGFLVAAMKGLDPHAT